MATAAAASKDAKGTSLKRRTAKKAAGKKQAAGRTKAVERTKANGRTKAAPSTKAARSPADAVGEAGKADKRRRKMVRDSFTMPREDFDQVVALKRRAEKLGRPARKSEVLRAGVHALAALDDTQFVALLEGLVVVKKGRPKNVRG